MVSTIISPLDSLSECCSPSSFRDLLLLCTEASHIATNTNTKCIPPSSMSESDHYAPFRLEGLSLTGLKIGNSLFLACYCIIRQCIWDEVLIRDDIAVELSKSTSSEFVQ